MIVPATQHQRTFLRVADRLINLARVTTVSHWTDFDGTQRVSVYFGENDKLTLRNDEAAEAWRLLDSPGFRDKFVALDSTPPGDGWNRGFPGEALR